MKIVNPFDTPEAAVSLYVEGITSIGFTNDDTKIYPLNITNEFVAYDMIGRRFAKLHDPKCKFVDISLASAYDLQTHIHIFGGIKNYKLPKLSLEHLKYTADQDFNFLRELHVLGALTVSVKSGIKRPDGAKYFFIFKFKSLEALTTHYGEKSGPYLEAKKLLKQHIRQLNKAFMTAYDGNILFTVVTNDIKNEREKRQAIYNSNRPWQDNNGTVPVEQKPDPKDLRNDKNIYIFSQLAWLRRARENSTTTDQTDPPVYDLATINIIFWLCISLFYALIAIAYTLVTMDPGRDSVVYRMTSKLDRIKME
ncbi:hypothetical protein O0L34_g13011 [Tuta absoluta]|nr:hypothetical protein O0L34_g13011 [Tuta absoluta]